MPDSAGATLRIGVVLYPGASLLDFVGPVQVFAFTPGAEVVLIAETAEPVVSNEGPAVVPGRTFADAPPLDAILVPGGGKGMVDAIGNTAYLRFLAEQGARAKWVTSVCNGAILLGAAGLLDGYEAITHWAWLDSLRKFRKVSVPTCVFARYHRDRNRVTAGGVSSGIDAALFLAGLWFGDAAAKGSQLANQYAPAPPYADGIPPAADPAVLAGAQRQVAQLVALTNAAIDRLGG